MDSPRGCDITASARTGSFATPKTPTEPFSFRFLPPYTPKIQIQGWRYIRQRIPPFRPHAGDLNGPLDILADELLTSQRFEQMCAQAMQLAGVIPIEPPPLPFISLTATPMHQWYESIIVEFTSVFARTLHYRGIFPVTMEYTKEGLVITKEDIDGFNAEACAHINAILRSFHIDIPIRPLGSLERLGIDVSQPNTQSAAMALLEVTQPAVFPPKGNWRTGETLHTAYRRRLWIFRIGVIRIIQDVPEDAWILGCPHLLERGVAAYAEYFIAHLREDILASRGPFVR